MIIDVSPVDASTPIGIIPLGPRGFSGWTAKTRVVTDGTRRVREIFDWTGGGGAKPATGYEGATGTVPDIEDAVDYRGLQGPEMLISGLAAAAADITDATLLPSAQPGDDNEGRAAVEVFDLGGELPRRTIAHAQASTVRKTISTISTRGFSSPADGGGASYVRVNSEPSHIGKFRTLDRWTPEGAHDSANGGWWELVTDEATPQMFGAVGNNAAQNAAAYIAWRDYRLTNPGGASVPGTTQSVSANPFLGFSGGFPIKVERGAKLSGPLQTLEPTMQIVGNPLTINVVYGDMDFDYELLPEFSAPISAKTSWLSGGDLEYATHKALSFSTDVSWWRVDPDGDTFTGFSPFYFKPDGDGVAFNLANDGDFRFGLMPVIGGDAISCIFGAGGTFERACIIETTRGYYIFYADAAGTATLAYKEAGLSIVEQVGITWPGRDTYDSWKPENVEWEIRNKNHTEFSIALNGHEVFWQKVATGIISRAGFGGRAASSVDCTLYNLVKRSGAKEPSGLAPINALILGDSTSEPIYGAWPDGFRKAIEGSLGCTINSLVNYAVAWHNSDNQLTKLLSLGVPTGTNVAIVGVGTNDGQQSVSSDVYKEKLNGIIDALIAANVRTILMVIEPLWYPKSLSPGGAATSNYSNASRYHADARWVAAKRGIGIVDMNQELRSDFASDLADPIKRQLGLRDNIHQGGFKNRAQGEAIARKVLALHGGPKITRAMTSSIHSSKMINGWTIGLSNMLSMSADGRVFLDLEILNGTVADGTIVLTLPQNLWPAAVEMVSARSTGPGPGFVQKDVLVGVNSAGQVFISDASGQNAIFVKMGFQSAASLRELARWVALSGAGRGYRLLLSGHTFVSSTVR